MATNDETKEQDLQTLVDEIINNYFSLTKIKLTPDDPTVAMLLAQRIDLNNQVDRLENRFKSLDKTLDTQIEKHEKRIENTFDDVINKTGDRFTEVDKRFQAALDLSDELKNERKRLLSDLSIYHQKNIINFTKEINTSIKTHAKQSLYTLIAAGASFCINFFLLIILLR